MSNYESEHGTWKLPSTEYAAFRQTIQKVEHDHKKNVFNMTQDFWKGLSRKEQTDPAAYREALERWNREIYDKHRGPSQYSYGFNRQGSVPNDIEAAITDASSELHRKIAVREKWNPELSRWEREGTGKPSRVLQSDIDWPTNRSTSFQMSDASVTFDAANKTVRWDVAEGNHSVEHARETALAKEFFGHLKKIKWTPGTGGYTKYDSENHEDEFGGRQGSSINGGWGYIGIDEYNHAGHIASVEPWQTPKGEWIGSEIVTGRGGRVSMKPVKGTMSRGYGVTKFVPSPKPAKKSVAKRPDRAVTARPIPTAASGLDRGVSKAGTNTGSFKSREHRESGISLGGAEKTSLPRTSPFADAKTLDDLVAAWDAATSPENIARDGEASVSQQRATMARLTNEYRTRMKELT